MGIGFVFTADDPFVGVDLDHCRDPETGEVEPWAQEIVDELDSYTEVSPSKTGLHSIVNGKLPPGGRRKGRVEMYEAGRYFTVTGDRVANTPETIEVRDEELARLHARTFGASKSARTDAESASPVLADDDVIALASQAKNQSKFLALWSGETGGYDSPSNADLALLGILSFYTGPDEAQLDRLFRNSKLMRDKWDESRGTVTYGQRTIVEALSDRTDFYRPDHHLAGAGGSREGLPSIHVPKRQLRDITDDALLALEQANDPPQLFQRGGELVRILVLANGRPSVDVLGTDEIINLMTRSADFFGGTKGVIPVQPPRGVANDILAQGTWGFPLLDGLTEQPVLRPDGTILESAGYDLATRLFHAPQEGLSLPPIPSNPSPEEVRRALDNLYEPFREFPFATEADYANTLACLLTTMVRPCLGDANVPIALFEAPNAGTGKGLLVDVISRIATGHPAAMMTATESEEEWRKRLTAALTAGHPIIAIDNIVGELDSAQLAAFVTAPVWQDRRLGHSEMITLPQRTTVVATGNDVGIGGDLLRRIYRIRLDAQTVRPYERHGWIHPDLAAWVHKNRGDLVWSGLTLARAWFAAGCPPASVPPMGSFERWAAVVGGILEHAEVPGFLANTDEHWRQVVDVNDLTDFLEAWHERFCSAAVTLKELHERLREDAGLREMLPEAASAGVMEDTPSYRQRLGKLLQKRADTRYSLWGGDGEVYAERASDAAHEKVATWRVVLTGCSGECGVQRGF